MDMLVGYLVQKYVRTYERTWASYKHFLSANNTNAMSTSTNAGIWA